ncbi:LOW QUALITY PROTEIN: hypothetical protein GGTG_08307 [Gaeumannomyces tritici R3-111a-1]|uniref:Uncharacterized protein n=1 Tax=Gaeumannomyces tritici (strain R3-111a-1) TaxID=644352 RepID=J3P471_GAET3|nr:LOW QUALITY PROTEIN: hypothetical protein GGTG_08307 [Gaeumannomyces tritici R3-111a-1]EJT74467.1 LOW QUALITY PROTEIN: hypothetical protein GGTG_08307 [Gaeumannomyces tritici R3-111a-1]
MASAWPRFAAQCSGVLPCSSVASTSAPKPHQPAPGYFSPAMGLAVWCSSRHLFIHAAT